MRVRVRVEVQVQVRAQVHVRAQVRAQVRALQARARELVPMQAVQLLGPWHLWPPCPRLNPHRKLR